MSEGKLAPILITAHDLTRVEDVCRILQDRDHAIQTHSLNGTDPDDVLSHPLVILGAGQSLDETLAACRRLRMQSNGGYLPILLVTDDHSPATRLAGFEAGADTCLLRPFASGELLAQVRGLLRIKDVHVRLAEKTAEVNHANRRLQQAYQQIDHELQLAKRIQASLLPRKLPEIPSLRFAVHYAPRNQVGGDFYDVLRLDENHVCFYVADAMGHGVPASLLTIFVKKGVQPKEVMQNSYRLNPPGDVLQKLNRDLIDQQLADHPFITMAYVLLNHVDGTLQFSRAGHPYPLYVPREGDLQFWEQQGLLLGVFEAQFENRCEQLRPGNKLLLYSDGVDEARFEGCDPGTASLRACAGRHRNLPIDEMIRTIAADLFKVSAPSDDLTLLGVEMQ